MVVDGQSVGIRNRGDPLYDGDDRVPLVINYGSVMDNMDIPVHQAQPKTNILHFEADPAHTHMQIWRTDKPNPRWSDLANRHCRSGQKRPRGIFYDTDLSSGVKYYYYLWQREPGTMCSRRQRNTLSEHRSSPGVVLVWPRSAIHAGRRSAPTPCPHLS